MLLSVRRRYELVLKLSPASNTCYSLFFFLIHFSEINIKSTQTWIQEDYTRLIFRLKMLRKALQREYAISKLILCFRNIDLDPLLANLVSQFLSLTSFFYSEEIINVSGKIKPSKREHQFFPLIRSLVVPPQRQITFCNYCDLPEMYVYTYCNAPFLHKQELTAFEHTLPFSPRNVFCGLFLSAHICTSFVEMAA